MKPDYKEAKQRDNNKVEVINYRISKDYQKTNL